MRIHQNILTSAVAALLLASTYFPVSAQVASAPPGTARSVIFPVEPHSDVSIEWWYLNTHVTTDKGRHLALIASFFRLGDADSAAASSGRPAALSHYLIYAITDEDAKTHSAYSLGDHTTLRMIQQFATLQLMQNPGNREAQQVLQLAGKGQFPPPTQLIPSECHVTASPFAAVFGGAASVRAVAGVSNTFALHIANQSDHINLIFSSTRPPMYVGGDGNTGVVKPDDMKYVSLTRCNVTGTLSTGSAAEKVASGAGWFDHQWGSSWTPQAVGWEWWGIQLDDGRDILVYSLYNITDGKTVATMATIEDAAGKLTVTRNVQLTNYYEVFWRSPRSHVLYPLGWDLDMPDLGLHMSTRPEVEDQEMPVLANGGAIWEGACHVYTHLEPYEPGIKPIGQAYMELVGYGSPTMKFITAERSRVLIESILGPISRDKM